MTTRIQQGGLQIASVLYDLIVNEALPNTGVSASQFWQGFELLLKDLTPKNRTLLIKRDTLQASIDQWHAERQGKGQAIVMDEYQEFLKGIGYLVDQGDNFSISTSNVDDEIAQIAGPQLVVPVTNARFALNAANARWGSLFDALYGSDIIDSEDGRQAGKGYNAARGASVVNYAMAFLDNSAPLESGSHQDVVEYSIKASGAGQSLTALMSNGSDTGLKQSQQFTGYNTTDDKLSSILLGNNGLHIELQIDRDDVIGKTTRSGIKDVVMESAVSARV